MSPYSVYLEVDDSGLCLAHVLDLPGLVLRAPSRELALRDLPSAVRGHHAWLHRHGESAPPQDETVEVEVVEESTGFGPFDPRSAAALFSPDREPLTVAELERQLRLLDYSRSDLLALVGGLPDELLDWRPRPDTWNLRRVLRHIGNAEEWYVSRLVPPETLPAEWQDDEAMPLFEFLEMERLTAVARLRQLTETERAALVYPANWTDHPDEPWTARKALRRFLEHELEHSVQVRELLSARRSWLMARVASERAALLDAILGLPEEALTGQAVIGRWTVKDVLAHVAGCDRWAERTMQSMASGMEPDLSALQDIDTANAELWANWRDRSLADVVGELLSAREAWLAQLENLTLVQLYQRRSYSGNDWSFDAVAIPDQWQHDAQHSADLHTWIQGAELPPGTGPTVVLLAALAAARQELLAAAALVPEAGRVDRPVCGEWTLKELLAHITDWEMVGVRVLRDLSAGRPPSEAPIHDIEAWNRSHAEARRDQPWGVVWREMCLTRQALLDEVATLSPADMARAFRWPWPAEGSVYEWLRVWLRHDRDHARDLRRSEG